MPASLGWIEGAGKLRPRLYSPEPEMLRYPNSKPLTLLGGSWDLASKVISTLSGVISSKK